MQAETIDDVIEQLSEIIDKARKSRSRLGFFPALYRRVTIAVKDGIAQGRFEDGERMARLDVIFANRYLEAYDLYFSGHRPTRAWRLTFEMAGRSRYIALQHLMLGMNAHINLDLGIAAVNSVPRAALPALRNDFNTVNTLLADLVDTVQTQLAEVSPRIGWLDYVGGRSDEEIMNFSMAAARDAAWGFAEHLASLDTFDQRTAAIDERDRWVELFAHGITSPGLLINTARIFIKMKESDDIPLIIDTLSR